MKKLYINTIGGFHNEFYTPTYISNDKIVIKNEYLDINTIFWNEIFNENNIKSVIDLLAENDELQHSSYQNMSIANDSNLFINNVLYAREKICDQGNSPQVFFQHLETMQALCDLYSFFYFQPYKLTIDQGLNFNELSSKVISDVSLNPSLNPLYGWIKNKILPIILDYNPDIIFFEGKPSVCLFTISKLLKRSSCFAHICITRHSSEYFSLNKIDYCLIKNKILFNFIDSIILEFFDDTEIKLIESLKNNISLENVYNIMFKNKNNEIIQTPYQDIVNNYPIIIGREKLDSITTKISPECIINVHIQPHQKCFWNKCTFCGINRKYHYIDTENTDIIQQLDILKEYINLHNIKYVWFLDEAISIKNLYTIANYFIENNITVYWQVRCRIEKKLIENDLPYILYKSGLRELRLGLESGSYYVLKLMNKFTEDFSFELLEQIISTYDTVGISIHTPIIIGFPGETKSERQKTYELLQKLKDCYHLFSFNINILGLDISSILFKEWYKYEIKKVELPYNQAFFLGNIVDWTPLDKNNDYKILEHERDTFMRKNMYPWLPHITRIKPYILYRLSETIRNTLIWKSFDTTNYKIERKNYIIKCAENTSIVKISHNINLIYQWNSHHYVIANDIFMNIFKMWEKSTSIENGIQYILDNFTDIYSYNELRTMIYKLIYNGFFTPIDNKEKKFINKSDLEHYYDDIYSSKKFPYAVKKDSWIEYYSKWIPVGKALELGIGNGKNIQMLLNMGYSIKGIDISGVAITQLKRQYNTTKCIFEHKDIMDFDIANNSYDLIICSMVLHYLDIEEVDILAKKIVCGLKENGVLLVSVLSEDDPLNHIEKKENRYVKTFFSSAYLKKIFYKLKIIEVCDSFIVEPQRKHPSDYFGIITYMGKKVT